MGFLELVRCWHGSLVGSQRDLVSSLGAHELPTCHWMTCSKKGALSCFHKLHLHEKSRDVDLPPHFFYIFFGDAEMPYNLSQIDTWP